MTFARRCMMGVLGLFALCASVAVPLHPNRAHCIADSMATFKRAMMVCVDLQNGMTPLMAAARDGHTAAAELLLSRGGSVTTTDKDGRSAAQYASAEGHHELAKRLGVTE
ncbi:unnamed protein product [Ostreobium quekettii]|uniref:Ankyrin repeat domain-containing protein n=1 Tax=Ostreobium quekettii TaxID=121088 RepID=A0A8S1IZS2_9CHLO|nr:unnamed protein product [Ostreobium quekettii]